MRFIFNIKRKEEKEIFEREVLIKLTKIEVNQQNIERRLQHLEDRIYE